MTYAIIQNKILKILEESKILILYDNTLKNFKISYHWLITFLK